MGHGRRRIGMACGGTRQVPSLPYRPEKNHEAPAPRSAGRITRDENHRVESARQTTCLIRKTLHWLRDYLSCERRHAHSVFVRKPPHHYLGRRIGGRVPVILVPGIYEKWHFLHAIADPISEAGHLVYVLENLGYNTRGIKESAEVVRELIEKEDLQKVIIIAHSKGGLIGKQVLLQHNTDRRVLRVITIATPFAGSHLAHWFSFLKGIFELRPSSVVISALHKDQSVNHAITSIYGVFDNHIWPNESCVLDGAENIQIQAHGHQ